MLADGSCQVEEWLASGRVEIAIYNRYRRGRVANADPLARAEAHLIARRDHPMARRRELAVRMLAEIPLAMPVRPNSLTSVLTGLDGLKRIAPTQVTVMSGIAEDVRFKLPAEVA